MRRWNIIGATALTALVASACSPAPRPNDTAATTAAPTAISTAIDGATPATSPTSVAATPAPVLTTPDEVTAAVAAASSITELPADLQPSLEDAATDYEDLDVTGCSEADRDPTLGRCIYGDPTGDQLVVLFGDSHAGMWLTSLHLAASEAGWQLRMFSKAACPTPMLSFYDRQEQHQNTDCDAYRTATIAAINALRPAVVVVTSATLAQTVAKDEIATSEMWQTGLTETLTALAGPSTRVVVLGDMPVLESTNPECLAAHPTDVQQCGSTREAALTGVYIDAERAAAAAAGADYLDIVDWFCTDRCSPVVAGRQVYRNRFHITAAYGTFLAGEVSAALHLAG